MRALELSALTVALLLSAAYARPQQQVDPAYLRDYYSQIAQRGSPTEATPIYEQEGPQNSQPQYLGQQIRVKDPSEQVRLPYATFNSWSKR